MIKTFDKIHDKKISQFSMPLSLRIIKESSQNNIDWKSLHMADLFSIIYAIRIEKAEDYLDCKRQQEMQKRGISSITKATEDDFNSL